MTTAVMVSADESEFRDIARQIEKQSPDWLVIWGVYTQQFVAFPLFNVPGGTILTAGYPDALLGRIQQTEQALRGSPHKKHTT